MRYQSDGQIDRMGEREREYFSGERDDFDEGKVCDWGTCDQPATCVVDNRGRELRPMCDRHAVLACQLDADNTIKPDATQAPAYIVEPCRGGSMDWVVRRNSDGVSVSYHSTQQRAERAARAWNRE